MLKRTPFYREILVGDDNIMAQVVPPGLAYTEQPTLYNLLVLIYHRGCNHYKKCPVGFST